MCEGVKTLTYKLTVQNYQSIENVEITFQNFTTIVGESNRGKSTILRALRTILNNDWHPSYLRIGAKECIITFEILEKTPYLLSLFPDFNIKKIQLRKPINEYIVFLDNGSELAYPKIGKGVPEIFSAFNLSNIVTEKDDSFNLNFQGQLDPLFLMTASEPSVTSFINKIFDISRFEKALREMSGDDLRFTRDMKDLDSQIPQINTAISGVEKEQLDLENKANILSALLDSARQKKQKFVQVELASQLAASIVETQKSVLNCKSLKFLLDSGNNVLNKFSTLLKRQSELREISFEVSNTQKTVNSFRLQASNIKTTAKMWFYLKIRLQKYSILKTLQDLILCKKQSLIIRNALSFRKTDVGLCRDIGKKLSNVLKDRKELQELSFMLSNLKLPQSILNLVKQYLCEFRANILKEIKVCPVCNKITCEDL